MANTQREDSELSIKEETSWGTVVSGNALVIPVNPGEWLHENLAEERDEMVRNILSRDFNSIPTVRSAEGSFGGLIVPIEPWHFLDAILGGTETRTQLRDTTGQTDTLMDVHEFTVGRDIRPLSVQQRDNIMKVADTEIYLGMLCTTFTLRGATGEGLIEWDAEMVGKGRLFANTPKTAKPDATSIVANPLPLAGSMLSVSIAGSTTAKLLDFEIVFSREVELAYGASATMVPNIRRQSAPRITFRATVELQDASDIQKYSSDKQAGADAQGGTPKLLDADFVGFERSETWHFRISTDRAINTTVDPAPTIPISVATGHTAGETFGTIADVSRALIDIYFDRVSYGESPLLIDRGNTSATFEFRGVALYDDTTAIKRMGVFRVMNSKRSDYSAVTPVA